jgi:hypothetical protein
MRRFKPEERRRPERRRGVWHLKLMTLSVCVAGARRHAECPKKKALSCFFQARNAAKAFR